MLPFIAALLWKCNTCIVARVVETFVSIVATITHIAMETPQTNVKEIFNEL
jgi:type III secretory pathway component EscS